MKEGNKIEPEIKTEPTSPDINEPVQELIGPDPNKNYSFKKLASFLLVIVVILLAAAGIFLVTQQKIGKPKTTPMVTPSPTPTATAELSETDTSTTALETQGVSDEITEIEKDLKATSLADIDKELADIETELSLP